MHFKKFALCSLSVLLLVLTSSCAQVPASIDEVSIASLQAKKFATNLTKEKDLVGTTLYRASLMSYQSDNLKLYTLVLEPTTPATKDGYPVLIFGHGFHPEPEKYGVSSGTGQDWRPGDYYRDVPERYAENGYLVLVPDYRGHNKSEGFEYTKSSFLATSYYASDVLHLLAALSSLPTANVNKVYYMGHSMGGDVGLKVLLATQQIRAASLWAPVVATTLQQALYYGRYYDDTGPIVNREKMDHYLEKIDKVYAGLPMQLDFEQVDANNYLDELNVPLIIHHARGDVSVPYIWSENLIVELHKKNKDYVFFAYDSDDHLFDSTERDQAIERDLEFFAMN